MQHPNKTLATCNMKTLGATKTDETFGTYTLTTYVQNICNIQIKTLATCAISQSTFATPV
jgi:hypothetical protein